MMNYEMNGGKKKCCTYTFLIMGLNELIFFWKGGWGYICNCIILANIASFCGSFQAMPTVRWPVSTNQEI